jgi:hypothetical protein
VVRDISWKKPSRRTSNFIGCPRRDISENLQDEC